MYAHELASIREFGFVDPVTVRVLDVERDMYEIIDGEHRWRAAIELRIEEIPCWDLGVVADETAQQLTIVLNETRGQSNRQKLALLVSSLAAKRSQAQLAELLPFSAETLAELSGARAKIDFAELQRKRRQLEEGSGDRWVERIYRLPLPAAEVIDEAISKVRQSGVEQDWRALELIAADYLGSPS